MDSHDGILAIAILSRPPDEPLADATIRQLLRSLAHNLIDASTVPVFVVPSSDRLASELRPKLDADKAIVALRKMECIALPAALAAVAPSSTLNIFELPETMKRRMIAAKPNSWDEKLSVQDVPRYGSLFRGMHTAIATRYAHVVRGAVSVLILTPESYLWKPTSVQTLLRRRHEVWYADNRGRAAYFPVTEPRPDTALRNRAFCSLLPWVGGVGGRVGGSTLWRAHAGRFAIGRDWALWENVTREAELLPAPDADLSTDSLVAYDAAPFGAYWARIEQLGGKPFLDSLVDALVASGELWKHCLRGDLFQLQARARPDGV